MEITNTIISSLKESITITLIILFLMIVVEIFVLKFQKKIIKFFNKNKFVEYFISSLFGTIPGCVGTFAMDSLYMAGLLGFGGIIAVMISTFGDEAFLLLSMGLENKISWLIIISLMGS